MSEYDKAGFRYVFKHNDEEIANWLKTQHNKAFSLKCLIYKAIQDYGDVDLQDYFAKRLFSNISGGGGLSDADFADIKKASKSNKIKSAVDKKLAESENAKAKPDKKTAVPEKSEVKSEVKPEVKHEAKSEPKPEPKPAAEVKPSVNKPVETAPNTNNDPLFDDDGFVDPDTLWQD